MQAMGKYTVRRLLVFLPLLVVASILVWSMIYLIPGDPALTRLGANATPAQLTAERHTMGLDRPVVVQYAYWLRAALHGDFGRSAVNDEPVRSLITRSFPVTFSLTVSGLGVGFLLGVLLGVAAALSRDGPMARFVQGYSSAALGIPSFVVGMLLIWLFPVHWGLLPSSGYVSFLNHPYDWARHMILPVATLAFYGSGIVARFVTASMSEALRQDYIWTARAKGLREAVVIRRHGFRNAAIPITTILGLQFGLLLGGAVIIEAVFNLPGMGRLLLNAVQQRDYTVVQGEVLWILIGVAIANIVVDIFYGVLDPRIRH